MINKMPGPFGRRRQNRMKTQQILYALSILRFKLALFPGQFYTSITWFNPTERSKMKEWKKHTFQIGA